MKIMFNISTLSKGGAERVISILANKLSQMFEVIIMIDSKKNISYSINEKVLILDLEKKYIKNPIIRNYKRMKESKRHILREQPDLIFTFLPIPSLRILKIKNSINVKVVVCERNDPKKEFNNLALRAIMKILYKRADAFVFQTKEQMEYFSPNIYSKSNIIYNPVNNDFLSQKADVEKEDTIISVGRLVEQKNYHMAIDIYSQIVQKYPRYKYKIFGEGPLRGEIQNYINSKGLSDNIVLCGISDNIKEELEKAKIFLMTSRHEGMPNALLEAMSMGLAVVSTDCSCGGPREVIINGKNGYLIKTIDEGINCIKKMIEDQLHLNILSHEAKKIVNILSEDIVINQWIDLIKKLSCKEMKK